MSDCFDVLGVGFGPANLALAIALREDAPGLTAHFVEAQHSPRWQGGMLLDGSNIQNHPVRDLVTLRNPRSRYSFVNYLFEHDRLIEHLNLPMEFPLRKDYARYIEWVTGELADAATFGAAATGVTLGEHGGAPAYVVTTRDGQRYAGRSLVVGTGRTPFIPEPFAALSSPRVVHLTGYLYRLADLPRPRRVVVIGGSQSGVEIVLDLARRYPDAEIVQYVRTHSLRLKDTSPFSEEGYFPAFTDYYYRASRSGKRALDAYMRPTNYSSTDADVLHELYNLIYEQRLDGAQRVFVHGDSEIVAATADADLVRLTVSNPHTGSTRDDEADLVVLATGFRDLGPEPHQEPFPALLSSVADGLQFDADGYLRVNEDYSACPVDPLAPPLFLNGLCESTHGIGDAGSFSLLSLRAGRILDGLRKHVTRTDARG